jgi:sugar phosphate isomerase/epimerase
MKLCFSTLACPDWTLPQIVDAARRARIEGVAFRGVGSEIDVTKLSAFNGGLEETLALFGADVAIPSYNTSVTLVTPAADRWAMMLDEAHRYARLAQGTATPTLRVFGGAVPKGMTFEECRSMAQRHLRQLAKVCRPCGCMVLVETHDDWSTSERIRELLHEFDPADAGVLWDIEHPWRHGEKPAETAETLRPYLRHIHFRDSRLVDGKLLPCLLGKGDLPLKEIVEALKGVGYDDWICLEVEKRWMPQEAPEPEETIPQFATFMRGAWVGA